MRVIVALLFLPVLCGVVRSEPAPMVPMLYATESRVVRFNAAGRTVWEAESGMARDVWLLPGGNVLFPFNTPGGEEGGVREVNPAGETVWEFRTTGWVLSCQRLPDGNTLVGAAGQCAVLIVDPAGAVVNTIPVTMRTPHKHTLTMARQLPDGNVLVVEENVGLIREYRPTGEVAWEMKAPFRPFGAARAGNGNTFISGQDGIVEVTPNREIVWRLTKEDVAAQGPRWFAGFQIRANGNIVVCNAGGKVPFFEVDRDKAVVWQTALTLQDAGVGHGICLTEEPFPHLR